MVAMFRILTVSLSLIVFAHFLFHSESFATDEVNYGIVRYVKGELFMLAKGEKARKQVQRMEKFYDGSELSTGPQSFAILKLPDGSALKLDPDSNLKVEGLIQAKGGNTYKGSSYLILTIGGIMVDVVQKFSGPPSLEIETTNRIAFGVRGTTFYIFHDQASSDVWGTVYKGSVEAMDYMHDDSETIDSGMSMAVVEGEVITRPHKYKWAERLRWSFAESDASLDTNRVNSTEERLKELQSLYQKLRTRPKKTFLKQKKAQEASTENGFRTSEGEYQLNEAGIQSADGSSNANISTPEMDTVPMAETPAATPIPTPVAPVSTQIQEQDDNYSIQLPTPTPTTPPPPAPPSGGQLEKTDLEKAQQQCANITEAVAKPQGCSGNEYSMAEIPAGNVTYHCCVFVSPKGDKIPIP